MLLRLLLPALALFLASPTPPPLPADPPLWVVRDADTTIYLFGSVHWLKPNLAWFDDEVRGAFDRADTLVLETPPVEPAEAQRTQDAIGKTANGPTLPERLPEPYRPKLAAALAELGYPVGAFDRVKPWLAATTLSILPLKRRGYDVSAGVEAVLTKAAQGAEKPIVGLEPRVQQLGYFDALPAEAQMAMLKRQLDNMSTTGDSTDAVLAAWTAGDTAALGRIIDADQRASSAAFGKAILSDRNRRWAGWIAERMKRPGTVFMAVGVGHLTGSDTVQRALAARGLTARRVRPAASR
ncbi:TraB/GumN family protein [uncultured Sphingomonas sp.]|uniref:TraB/GumN family protein n=1 Tax=uncultured Sphingomonas sp. TaxID=158754 RepID=UPI0025F9688B|nr:TraB/GumN family protein [uncultured Sphingomonas sp.]